MARSIAARSYNDESSGKSQFNVYAGELECGAYLDPTNSVNYQANKKHLEEVFADTTYTGAEKTEKFPKE